MKSITRSILFGCLFAFCMAQPVAAWPPGDNVLGLYTSTDDYAESYHLAALGAPFTVYIVLSGCTFETGIGGYEFGVVNEPGTVTTLGSTFYNAPIIIDLELDNIHIALMSPLPPTGGVVPIGEIPMLSLGGVEYIYLRPARLPTVEGQMLVADGADPGNTAVATPASGDFGWPCFLVNETPPDPVATSTWGAVRQLYR